MMTPFSHVVCELGEGVVIVVVCSLGTVCSALHQPGALLQAPGEAPRKAERAKAMLWAEKHPETGALGPAGHREGKEEGWQEGPGSEPISEASVSLLQLLDNAVYTLELFLQPAANLQPVCVPVNMAKAKERVLKVRIRPPGSNSASQLPKHSPPKC